MQISRYEDGLDSMEKELIERLPHPWQRIFLKRFYELLQKHKLKKKDIPQGLEHNPDKEKLLSAGYVLPESTLSECTNFHSSKLRVASVETIISIAITLNVSADYLLGLDTTKIPKREYDSAKARIANEILDYILENKENIRDEHILQKVKKLERLKKDVSDNDSEHPFFMP